MTSATAQHMTIKTWALLLLLSLIWGGSFIFNRYALIDFEPLTVVAGRVAIAAVVLHLFLRFRGIAMPGDRTSWGQWAMMGILNNAIPFTLIVWGQTRIEPGLASILNATTPLFGVVIAHVLTADERLTSNRMAGVGLGIAGVLVLVGPDVIGTSQNSIAGQIAILGASLAYALGGLWGRRLRRHPAMVNATGQVTCSAIIMLVLAVAIERPWKYGDVGGSSVMAILGLGLLSTAVGYTLYFRILGSSGATNVMLVTLIIPVSALWLSWLFFSESITLDNLVGMILIGAGLLAIDGRLLRRFRSAVMQSQGKPVSVLNSENKCA